MSTFVFKPDATVSFPHWGTHVSVRLYTGRYGEFSPVGVRMSAFGVPAVGERGTVMEREKERNVQGITCEMDWDGEVSCIVE